MSRVLFRQSQIASLLATLGNKLRCEFQSTFPKLPDKPALAKIPIKSKTPNSCLGGLDNNIANEIFILIK
jgi:hypothetical protein